MRSIAVISSVLCFTCIPTTAQTTRVSLSTSGVEPDNYCTRSTVSADGRYVVFDSRANNLVPADTNNAEDVFVRDRQTGTTERVSLGTGGVQGNVYSEAPSISADGRFVAFGSLATNLVAGDSNGTWDVFVRDRVMNTTERVSVSSSEVEGDFGGGSAWITPDGRFVVFASGATNLVSNDTNGFSDVFVRDRQMGTTAQVSLATGGMQGDGGSLSPTISPDGRYIAFQSNATNFAAGDSNGDSDVFVRDVQTATTVLVSASTSGSAGNWYSEHPSVSADGRYVAFESRASDLISGDTNNAIDIFVRDLVLATTVRINVGPNGEQSTTHSYLQAPECISDDGRYVVFACSSALLVPGDTNGVQDLFVRDLFDQTTARVTIGGGAVEANAGSSVPMISATGRFVCFRSDATNLVPGDTNAEPDIYLHDRGLAPVDYCFGDGSDTPCPCGNASTFGARAGCANSLGLAATLRASGTPSIASDSVLLTGRNMPNSFVLYFQGTAQQNGGNGSVFGDGLRCASGSVIRLGIELNAGGTSRYPGSGDPSVSVKGQITLPGIRTYQAWYRDALTFCTVSTFNLSNGVQFTWAL